MKSRLSAVNFAIHPLSFVFIVYIVSGGKLLSSALAGAMCNFIAGVGLADLPIELVGMKTWSRFYDIVMPLPREHGQEDARNNPGHEPARSTLPSPSRSTTSATERC